MNPVKPLIFVGIGEVLYDVFEDGTATLGGAPLNVAVHAHQLAAPLGIGSGVMASRIGTDRRGDEILAALRGRGMSTHYIQRDSEHPTGTVSVFMRDGEPGYQIEAGAAWDYVVRDESLDELAATCDAVCFGTLAQRSAISRAAVQGFLRQAHHALRLFDVNLRRNTLTHEEAYSSEIIERSCELATIIKVNAQELVAICGILGIANVTDRSEDGNRRRVQELLARFPANAVVLTRAEHGTTLFTRAGEFQSAVSRVPEEKVHPVGAGDACSAGILFGLALGWEPPRIVELANRLGSWVASQLSATPPLPDSILEFVV